MTRLVTLVLTAVLALLASPAAAGSGTFYDKKGDVGHALDIHRVQVEHRDRLIVRVKVRKFVSGGITVWIDTGGNAEPDRVWNTGVAGDTDWSMGRTNGWRAKSLLHCDSKMTRNYTTKVLTASISRECLGATQKVRVSVDSAACKMQCSRKDFAPARHRYYGWVSRS